MVSVAANLGNQPLRGESGRLLDGCPDHGTQGEDGFVDRHEVNKVTHLTPPSCGHHLIQRKVNRVQNVAESLIPHCREEAEIAVNDPSRRVLASSRVTSAV